MKLIAPPLSAVVFATLLSLCTDARAEPPGPPARTQTSRTVTTTDYVDKDLQGDQVVTFTGDELAGMSGGPYGNILRRPPGVTRAGLIRPRMNFVSELLKSVENL